MTINYQSLRFSDHLGCRILICDDAIVDVIHLTALLTAIGYQQLATSTHLQQALSLLEKNEFDFLLLGLNRPYADGIEIICRLRQKFSPSELPILVITSSPPSDTRNAALQAGANDYLNLPVDPVELALRVRNLLSIRSIQVVNQTINRNQEQVIAARTAMLDTLIENGLLMSATRDVSKLFHHALFEGQRLFHCDAASLYLVTQHQTLRFAMRTRNDPIPTDEIALFDPTTGKPNDHYISVFVALHRKSVLIDDVYLETRFDVSGTKSFDQLTKYRTVSMLTVPLASRDGQVSGVLQFMNRLDPISGRIIAFPPHLVSLAEALAAQAAVTYENLQLLDQRKNFIESLIHTIATAIDTKSPYTGRHSERVPVLALALAEAASASTEGSLADFNFKTEDQWHEFRVGAWLHDCGKITTPEHVIDKATKLETIYNPYRYTQVSTALCYVFDSNR